MAYDQNGAYEAPRRPYYGQPQPQAAQQYAYSRHTPIQVGGGYDQGYEGQQYGNQGGYATDMVQGQESSYSDGYAGGYQRLPNRQKVNGQGQDQRNYDPRYQQRQVQQPPQPLRSHSQDQIQPNDRSYDPRYQQQPVRAPTQGYAQHPSERTQLYQQSPMQSQQGRQDYQGQPPPQQRSQAQAVGYAPPAASRSHGNGSVAPKAAAAPQPQKQDPKKMTMEEWKAKEKAKMHADAQSPEGLAQDNAFPTFPNMKKDRLKPDNRSGGQSAMSHRSSGDQARSSVSSGPAEVRPTMSRDNSYNREVQASNAHDRGVPVNNVHDRKTPPQQSDRLAPQSRPSLDHKPFSFEPLAPQQQRDQERPAQQHQGPGYAVHPSGQRRPSGPTDSPMEIRQQRPMYDQQSLHARQSPPNANGNQQTFPHAHPDQREANYRSPPPQSAQQRPGPPGQGRPYIDTSYAQQERSAYLDHQPLSPAQVPPRPSTAHSARPTHDSPQSQFSYAHTPVGYTEGQAIPMHHPQQTPQVSTSNLRDDYVETQHTMSPVNPRRDQEIEAEMPDFDSAAPQQTSMLHKKQTARTPPPAAAPFATPQQPNYNAQAVPVNPKLRSFGQHDDPYQAMARLKQVQPKQKPPADRGFDFGLGNQAQPVDQAYGQDHGALQQDMVYGPPAGPPQPRFAHEPPPRRSMDDARGMPPYRQGGAGQPGRSHPNGQPVRGPSRPEMDRNGSGQTIQTVWSEPGGHPRGGPPPSQFRPEMDRNGSGQTVHTMRSEPGYGSLGMNGAQSAPRQPLPPGGWAGQPERRTPSAPPLRQGLQAPPPGGPPMGAPLTQQRSAPEQQPEQRKPSNPDALPKHPTPVRPGLMEGMSGQPAKPPPVRNYNGTAQPATSHQRNASVDPTGKPVTRAELDSLRAAVAANPANNKQALLLAKKLVEASTVLASDNGRADPRTTAKNRENYILDAHKRVKKLVSAGYPEAQFYLADSYGQGALGLEVDTKEAFNLYQAAAKQGHPQAAYRTAVCCEMGPEEGGGTRKDYAKAVQWYRRAAALGDVPAMFKLGMILLKALLGQPRNVGESVIWLKRAAERADRDNPHALHELGILYEPDNTDPEVRNKIIADENYARELFLQAAGLGYKFSQFRLGQAYEYGSLGLPIDNRASISYYSKAAAQGEHQAELALSGWYLTGAEGILQNSDTEAYLWARKAAQAEPPLAKAMFAMGYFSEMGIGCPASIDDARKWYGRAASYKFPKALERLEELKRSGKGRAAPANGKLMRKDQKRDEAECSLM